jgi:hypothetical protein
LTIDGLKVPSTLARTLRSTNAIVSIVTAVNWPWEPV